MDEQTVFSSLEGEALVVPQSGALDITTELGKILVRQNEITKAPGTAVVDFACVGPHWQMAENTFPVPWYHRNAMQEFVFGINNNQREDSPLNHLEPEYGPVAAFLNGAMATHGPGEELY